MSTILAYDIYARKKVQMENPEPYQMKNRNWALKGTSSETGIKLFKIVGKQKPVIEPEEYHVHSTPLQNRMKEFFHNLVFGRNCECGKPASFIFLTLDINLLNFYEKICHMK